MLFISVIVLTHSTVLAMYTGRTDQTILRESCVNFSTGQCCMYHVWEDVPQIVRDFLLAQHLDVGEHWTYTSFDVQLVEPEYNNQFVYGCTYQRLRQDPNTGEISRAEPITPYTDEQFQMIERSVVRNNRSVCKRNESVARMHPTKPDLGICVYITPEEWQITAWAGNKVQPVTEEAMSSTSWRPTVRPADQEGIDPALFESEEAFRHFKATVQPRTWCDDLYDIIIDLNS